jgi:hypothetical protein
VRVRVQNCYSVRASAKVCESVSARESANGRRVGGGWPPSLHLFSTLLGGTKNMNKYSLYYKLNS